MFITVAFYLNRSYELCIIRNTNYGTVLYARALKTVPRDSLVNSFLFLKNIYSVTKNWFSFLACTVVGIRMTMFLIYAGRASKTTSTIVLILLFSNYVSRIKEQRIRINSGNKLCENKRKFEMKNVSFKILRISPYTIIKIKGTTSYVSSNKILPSEQEKFLEN